MGGRTRESPEGACGRGEGAISSPTMGGRPLQSHKVQPKGSLGFAVEILEPSSPLGRLVTLFSL